MILDDLGNSASYPFGDAWQQAMAFIKGLSADAELGRHELRGSEMYAQVAQYDTRTGDQAVLESHRRYVDIQVVLSGRERVEVSSTARLVVRTPYSEQRDVMFYEIEPADAYFELKPGRFAVFFPHDAHMPNMAIAGVPEPVRKVVVKIAVELLTAR